MKHDTHTQHILKNGDSFYIRICNCGVIHLCFGATTVNLSEEALLAVSETLKDVCHEMLSRRQKEVYVTSNLNKQDENNLIQGNFKGNLSTS